MNYLSRTHLLVDLVDERLVDMRDNTSACNGCLDESVELLVSSNSELQMARSDTLHLCVGREAKLNQMKCRPLESKRV